MKISEKTIHNSKLTNNCPTCFATNGLEVSFTQEIKESAFSKKASQDINGIFTCRTCSNTIYPVDWNEDIERVFDYHKKVATINMLKSKTKPMLYWVLGGVVLITGIAIYIAINMSS